MTTTRPSLADIIDARIARLDDRSLDWDALKFQEKVNPRYRRAQMRYVGTGATGVKSDTNIILSVVTPAKKRVKELRYRAASRSCALRDAPQFKPGAGSLGAPQHEVYHCWH